MDVVNRTFVGIGIPQETIESRGRNKLLRKRQPRRSELRWNVPSEPLISLCQLGGLSIERLQRLRAVLPQACSSFAPMTLTLEGFGCLPNLIQPRYAYLGITGDTERLGQVEAALWS